MTLTAQDRVDITDLINLHGHLTDDGELDRAEELFSADVTYDVTEFGLGILHGIEAIREAARAMGAANPVGHHVTNIVITPRNEREAQVRSKGIGINANGAAGSVVYDDVVAWTAAGWRIRRRKVTARRRPAGPRGVLERWRQAVVDQSVDEITRIYASDAIHEFPFTAPGLPSRLEGRSAIVAWTTEAWQADSFRYLRYRTLASHTTSDPNTIVVEQEALGTSDITGEFALPNILVLTSRDGQIVHVRDYVNIYAAAAALGRDLTAQQSSSS